MLVLKDFFDNMIVTLAPLLHYSYLQVDARSGEIEPHNFTP